VLNDKSVLSETSVATLTIYFIVCTMNILASKCMKQMTHSKEHVSESIHMCFISFSSFFFVNDSEEEESLRKKKRQ
jgi:hypothetical protein